MGKISSDVLSQLIVLQIPYLLGLLLPIGLFFGILFVLGRMYADYEMTILFACGMKPSYLLWIVMRIALIVAVLIGVLTLWLNPILAKQKDQVMNVAVEQAFVSSLLPGRFQVAQNGGRVFYVQKSLGPNHKVEDLFMAEQPENTIASAQNHKDWIVLSAETAEQQNNQKTNAQFFVAQDGYRYQGVPGQPDYLVVKFDQYGIRINGGDPLADRQDDQAESTLSLLMSATENLDFMAELQWRLSIPLVTLILALLAVPLSRVKPRQGKYAQLLPAVFICICYVNLLFVARAWVDKGKIPPIIGVWWVHILVLLVALGFFGYQRWKAV